MRRRSTPTSGSARSPGDPGSIGAGSPGPGRPARAPWVVALAAALGFACGDASPPTRAGAQASPALAPDHGAAAAASSADADAAAPFAALGLAPLAPEPRAAWPTESPHVTSYFGWRVNPITGTGQKLHRGLDLRGQTGDLALAIADGEVRFAGHDPFLGRCVIVDHGAGVTSWYGHLSDLLVAEGTPVARGAAIGLVGNTGRSQAPHLHLTVKIGDTAVDPLWILGLPIFAYPALVGAAAPAEGDDAP